MRNGRQPSDTEVASRWYEALARCSNLPDDADTVIGFLRGCTTELRAALATPHDAADSAVRCGERLVQHLFLSLEALTRTLDLLDRELGHAAVNDLERDRWSQLRNEFTRGCVSAMVERVRHGQTAVHRALQDSMKDAGRQLLRQCATECAASASDAACCGIAMLLTERH